MIEESREIGRRLLQGISLYSKERGPWVFYRQPPFYYEGITPRKLLKHIAEWGPDGIIMSKQAEMCEEMLEIGVPAILSGFSFVPNERVRHITADDLEIGRMAADHLVDKGYCHFAFFGYEDMDWSMLRGEGFSEHLRSMDFSSAPHLASKRDLKSWFKGSDLIAEWILNLPKPCGVFVCNDDLCWQVAEACSRVNVNIPEDIGLLGVDNDPLICDFATPPLSSIVLKIEKSGYEAAALLERMMRGEAVGECSITTPAPRVETRQSTDVAVLTDPVVAKAMNYIRQHYRKGVMVEDVARAAGASRRVLEKRFKDMMHRSIYEEVLVMRMNHAAFLLTETNLTIGQISDALNYEEMKYFSRGFRKITGLSPMAYRKKHSVPQLIQSSQYGN